MRKISRLAATVFFLVIIEAVCFGAVRNPDWAVPVELSGVPNLYRVTKNIYRGAMPTAEGLRELEKLGVKTVINLRAFHGDDNKGTSLREIRVRMHAWDPDVDDIVRVLRILSDESGGPYFVHCQHGADRTGLITA
ncbi:MAG: tyrosine-protein phosphatase, partial [Synergistaceae bacterium]|nr:tyrosine-protein phosphatase [Synergistaceae bacterium]